MDKDHYIKMLFKLLTEENYILGKITINILYDLGLNDIQIVDLLIKENTGNKILELTKGVIK